MKDFEELHKALQQMIDGKNTMSVPAREDEDADLILAQGIKEHREMKEVLIDWLDCFDTPDEWMRCRNNAKKILGREHT